jgi:hypothetical protein
VTRSEAKATVAAPPLDIDAAIERFDRLSSNLVLLESGPLSEVRDALRVFDAAVRGHLASAEAAGGRAAPASGDGATTAGILESDHRRFLISLDQLWWFFRVVESDDHGGHRQALGQYGRLLAEALRRHRADERTLPVDLSATDRPGSVARPSGKR